MWIFLIKVPLQEYTPTAITIHTYMHACMHADTDIQTYRHTVHTYVRYIHTYRQTDRHTYIHYDIGICTIKLYRLYIEIYDNIMHIPLTIDTPWAAEAYLRAWRAAQLEMEKPSSLRG